MQNYLPISEVFSSKLVLKSGTRKGIVVKPISTDFNGTEQVDLFSNNSNNGAWCKVVHFRA